MSRTSCRALAVAVLAGWLVAVAPVSAAVAPKIKDDAKFFSDEARTNADKKIKDIYRDFGKDLLIETFPEVPAEKAKDIDFKDKDAREKFFEEWARDRASDAEVNGIYILICKSPAHLQVEVGNETQKKAFTRRDRSELIKILAEKFRAKKYDEGLSEAVDFVGQRLKANKVQNGTRSEAESEWGRRRARAAVPAVIPGENNKGGGAMDGLIGLVCVGLVVLLAIWVVVALFRAIAGGGNRGGYAPGGGGYAPGYGGGGGGGGFFNSLLGGMFGAVAGNWMYNSFFGGGGSSWGGSQGGMGGAGYNRGDDAASRPDTDYSGGGADFGGDDGSGGDAGGGGADFGGGGGDFGGGGGSDF